MMKKNLFLTVVLVAGFIFTIYALQEERESAPVDHPPAVLKFDDTPMESQINGRVASYADVLEDVTQGVVSVFSTRTVRVTPGRQRNPLFDDPNLRRFFGIPDDFEEPDRGGPQGETRRERRPLGLGSGVIVSQDGYILTNNHVIEGADEILVRLSNGREFEASLVGADEKTDIAVIRIKAEGLPALTLTDSDQLRVGDVVFAVGHPLQVGLTVTMGIVSATARSGLGIIRAEGAYEDFIQTDASINPGNSGGPLVDAKGRVVGINTAILSRTGGNIGIGFAIPTNLAKRVMESLIEFGKVPRGFLGIRMNEVSQEMAQAFGLPDSRGALVEDVLEGLPAAEAGVKHGDFIIRVNDRRINSPSELRSTISMIPPGSKVRITLIRKGETKVVEAVLGDADLQAPVASTPTPVERQVLPGVSMEPLSDALREQYNIPEPIDGLAITRVASDSPYGRLLTEGMVIREINQTAVTSLDQARELLQDEANTLWVYFEGRSRFISIRIRGQ